MELNKSTSGLTLTQVVPLCNKSTKIKSNLLSLSNPEDLGRNSDDSCPEYSLEIEGCKSFAVLEREDCTSSCIPQNMEGRRYDQDK